MVIELFDGSDSDDEDLSKIEIDKEFARRFEHNKKREDLQRYEELEKRGLVPSRLRGDDEDSEESSSEDDDDDDVVSKKTELKFFENLLKIRKKDPILKSKDVKLFESESDEDEDEDEKKNEEEQKRKKKGVYLKDLAEQHLIEEGADSAEKDRSDITEKLAYNDEQEELRNAFLAAAEEDGDGDEDDDLLTLKEKKGGEEKEESGDEELRKKVDEYFAEESNEDANFLKEYFLNKMWVDKSNEKVDDEELEMLSEDDKEVEKQEEYEYRFQENAGDQVIGHSRVVEGTVRKKVKARKEQRKHKEERMEIARQEREEELRHLKNLKKKEIDQRIKRVMKTAGIDDDEVVPLTAKELEEEFDPEEYDRMMKKAFGDRYYEAEDVDPGFGSDDEDVDGDGLEKPDFDKEDELLGLPKGWDGSDNDDDGFLAARKRSLKHKVENGDEEENGEDEEEEEEEEEVNEEVKRKRKRKSAILEKAKEAMLEEYYKLDYEDTIEDVKTRFKYAKIKPNRYGLSTTELLTLDDKELNQYVSLKKIAPYKDNEWKVPNSKRYEIKMKARDALLPGNSKAHKLGKKEKKRGVHSDKPSSSNVDIEAEKAPFEEASNLSRNARRRKLKAELKLSQPRLRAYGKIESKSKKKDKH